MRIPTQTHVIGATDLSQWFLDRAYNNEGCLYLTDNLDRVLNHIPVRRHDDVIILRSHNTKRPFALNLFATNSDGVLDLFKALWPTAIPTPNIDLCLLLTSTALQFTPEATLFGIHYMLVSECYRDRVLSHVPKGHILHGEWKRYEQRPQREKDALAGSTMARVLAFMLDPMLRNIVGFPEPSFQVTATITNGSDQAGKQLQQSRPLRQCMREWRVSFLHCRPLSAPAGWSARLAAPPAAAASLRAGQPGARAVQAVRSGHPAP